MKHPLFKYALLRLRRWALVLPLLAATCFGIGAAEVSMPDQQTFSADDKRFQYVGRIDFTNSKLPRFWSPGVYITADFAGPSCDVLLNDQVLWGNSHNYVEVVVDGVAKRYQLTGATNTLSVADGLADGKHTLVICKDTESGIGYLEFAGLRCEGLAKPDKLPRRKIEFIGDSITAGASSDTSDAPCGGPVWYAQHNAYMSYGPKTARALNAQWMVSAVAGIGLIHSCCNMTFTMPDVYDHLATRPASATDAEGDLWDFSLYQPDVVTVCLGQNDGTANPATFVAMYETFVEHLRSVHPGAEIVLLTSPMGDPELTRVMKANLTEIVKHERDNGDKHVSTFFFSRSWNDGCGSHPSVDNHTAIASELSAHLKTFMRW